MDDMYHYTDCGLDNVWLANGVEEHDTAYGKGTSIHDVGGLHIAIGMSIINEPNRIKGDELRFLRIEMDMTQRDLGECLGSDEQCVRRWEKDNNKEIPNGPADRLLRILYNDFVNGDGAIKAIVDRLSELNQVDHKPMTFANDNDIWVPQLLAA